LAWEDARDLEKGRRAARFTGRNRNGGRRAGLAVKMAFSRSKRPVLPEGGQNEPLRKLPARLGNLPAPSSNLPAWRRKLPALSGNLPARRGNLPAPRSNLPAPSRKLPAPRGNPAAWPGKIPARRGKPANVARNAAAKAHAVAKGRANAPGDSPAHGSSEGCIAVCGWVGSGRPGAMREKDPSKHRNREEFAKRDMTVKIFFHPRPPRAFRPPPPPAFSPLTPHAQPQHSRR
jgi:hypothetical protein